MKAFFSGTDWSNLEDRAEEANYFMMLIVNFSGEYVAKVAFKAKLNPSKKTTISMLNNHDGFCDLSVSGNDEKEVLVVMDCNIVYEDPAIEQDFSKRLLHVINEAEKEEKARKTSYKMGTVPYKKIPIGTDKEDKNTEYYRPSYDWDGYDDWNGYTQGEMFEKTNPTDKPISEMTDKEWENYEINNNVAIPFDSADVKTYLNLLLTDGKEFYDDSSPLLYIKELNLAYKKDQETVEDEIDGLGYSMEHYFELLFPGKAEQYNEMLDKVLKLLKTYKKTPAVKLLIEAFDEEKQSTKV